MNKKIIAAMLLGVASLGYAKDEKVATTNEKVEQLDIRWVDTFKAMRECAEGQKVGKELDAVREKLSKEIQDEAQKLALEEKELKSKMATMKKDVAERKERELAKRRRALEDKVRDGEEELKITMQNQTEKLATQVEKSIVEVAKEKGADAVIDKMTGRVLYTKEGNPGDITSETIAHLNKKDENKKAAPAA